MGYLLIYYWLLCCMCVIFLPGDELSAMAESPMRFFSPLKLHLFHCRLRWRVTVRI